MEEEFSVAIREMERVESFTGALFKAFLEIKRTQVSILRATCLHRRDTLLPEITRLPRSESGGGDFSSAVRDRRGHAAAQGIVRCC